MMSRKFWYLDKLPISNYFTNFAADMRKTIKKVFKYRVARWLLNTIRAIIIAFVSFVILAIIVWN